MAAGAAENCLFVELFFRPHGRFVIGDLRVTLKTRIPTIAAFEFDRDDVEVAVPVSAASLIANIISKNLDAIDRSTHATPTPKPFSAMARCHANT